MSPALLAEGEERKEHSFFSTGGDAACRGKLVISKSFLEPPKKKTRKVVLFKTEMEALMSIQVLNQKSELSSQSSINFLVSSVF